MSSAKFRALSNLIVKDPNYGITFKLLSPELYSDYCELHRRNHAESGIVKIGDSEVILLYYYGKLIGAFAVSIRDEVCHVEHLLIDRDFRGRGFGKILACVTTFYAQLKHEIVVTQYRDRELYAKLYSDLGFREFELLKSEQEK